MKAVVLMLTSASELVFGLVMHFGRWRRRCWWRTSPGLGFVRSGNVGDDFGVYLGIDAVNVSKLARSRCRWCRLMLLPDVDDEAWLGMVFLLMLNFDDSISSMRRQHTWELAVHNWICIADVVYWTTLLMLCGCRRWRSVLFHLLVFSCRGLYLTLGALMQLFFSQFRLAV